MRGISTVLALHTTLVTRLHGRTTRHTILCSPLGRYENLHCLVVDPRSGRLTRRSGRTSLSEWFGLAGGGAGPSEETDLPRQPLPPAFLRDRCDGECSGDDRLALCRPGRCGPSPFVRRASRPTGGARSDRAARGGLQTAGARHHQRLDSPVHQSTRFSTTCSPLPRAPNSTSGVARPVSSCRKPSK